MTLRHEPILLGYLIKSLEIVTQIRYLSIRLNDHYVIHSYLLFGS